mmetsp:Transcript_48970/g.83681  ORF Transcript_48970/g.83681 Transcript_48970/m.83681 type:complete len:433 (+) Transcript_48970:29-1327(+)
MMTMKLVTFCIVSLFTGTKSTTVFLIGNDPNVVFSGRTHSFSSETVSFDNPGVSFTFTVENTTNVTAFLSQKGVLAAGVNPRYNIIDHINDVADEITVSTDEFTLPFPNFFEVYVDGVWQPNMDDANLKHSFGTWNSDSWLNGNVVPVTVALGMSPISSHTVTVFKSTEAQWNSLDPQPNYMTLHGIQLNGDSIPAVVETSKSKFGESVRGEGGEAARKLEFLGDSLTCGYCNICHEQPAYPDGAVAESFAESWPSAVASMTSAEFHAVAWSGYGLTHNCCGGSTLMPEIYTRALASVFDGSADWDFRSWVPDAVVVNLGTNDVNSGDYDATEFTTACVNLATNVTARYGEATAIFLACGPVSSGYCAAVTDCLGELSASAGSTGFPSTSFFLDQTDLGVELDCCWHPTSADDALMARTAAEFISKSMGWAQ